MKAVETIRQIARPMVAYKILAAGRLPPEKAFASALSHIAPQGAICVGAFPKDKPGMIAEDISMARKHSKS